MPLIDQPWSRVRNPVPLPAAPDIDELLSMDANHFAQLIRSHLMPREQAGSGRRSWDELWAALRSDGDLADRTYDVLEDFLDSTDQALEGGEFDDAEAARARKFKQQCEQAWKRIDRGREKDRPLAWAGRAGNFPPHAARVIATVVSAIARHRSATQAAANNAPRARDEELWAVLRRINLDPADYTKQN